MKKFLSWLAISFGIIYFFYETWHHISYDQFLNNKAQSSKTCCAFYVLKRKKLRLDVGAKGFEPLTPWV